MCGRNISAARVAAALMPHSPPPPCAAAHEVAPLVLWSWADGHRLLRLMLVGVYMIPVITTPRPRLAVS